MEAINALHFFPTSKPNRSSLPTSKLYLKPAQNLLKQPNIHRVVSITTPEPSPMLDQNHRPINITTNSNPCNDQLQEKIQESVTAYWDYQFLFVSQRAETVEPVQLQVVEGEVPSDFPPGTYYLTGPGIFSDDHGSTVHPLDGHGYLRAFKIDGDVQYSAKYIKTDAQKEECNSETGEWTFTYRGPFSVLRGGKKFGNTKVMKNVANTSVLKWGGKLLCLWEGGDPYEIDIENGHLDTVGIFDLINRHHLQPEDVSPGGVNQISEDAKEVSGDGGGGFWDFASGVVKPILHGIFKMPPKRLLSHYKIDPTLDRLLTVSCNAEDMLIPRSSFTFYEFDSNFKLLQKQEFDIPEHMMNHDWAFTETHYVLFGNRIKLDVPGSMLAVCGLSPMITALSVNPNKPTSPIYVLPRFPDKVKSNRDWTTPVEAPSQMWVLHAGNAFELTDQRGNLEIQIHAAICSYKWFNFHKMFGYNWKTGKLDPSFMNARNGQENTLPHLVKVSIKLQSDGNFEECTVEALNNWSKPTDFPAINPAFSGTSNTCIYAATSSNSRQSLPHFPFDTVVKLNLVDKSVSTWSVGSRCFIGEPVFVPKGTDEEDGYLVVIEYAVSIQKCYMVILDPNMIGKSEYALVAKLEVPKHLNFPLGFHGFWAAVD
ncbi:carotenoid cleavage dioxygenase 7, chloroplastic-like [Papaver somniferum]|nr:carotenoid cleavage dioxygenase 7, chloroplastic-like [Papaver somniferum]